MISAFCLDTKRATEMEVHNLFPLRLLQHNESNAQEHKKINHEFMIHIMSPSSDVMIEIRITNLDLLNIVDNMAALTVDKLGKEIIASVTPTQIFW